MNPLSFPRAARALVLGATLTAGAISFHSPVQAAPKAAPTYTTTKDGYAIYLPGKPKTATRQVALPNGAKMNVNFISVSKPPVTYFVIPMRLPAAPKGAAVGQFLNGVERGFTMSTAAKLVSSKSITLNGNPGREVVLQVGANQMRCRFFVAGSRSFQVVAVAPKSSAARYSAQTTKVLDSFRILR